jgi:hypothetical protein
VIKIRSVSRIPHTSRLKRRAKILEFYKIIILPVKSIISLSLVTAILVSSVSIASALDAAATSFRPGGGPTVTTTVPLNQLAANLPLTTSPNAVRIVESSFSGANTEATIAAEDVSGAISRLITLYEARTTRLQDEINRIKIENTALRAQLAISTGDKNTASLTPVTVNPVGTTSSTNTGAIIPKTEQEKRYNAIVSNVNSSLPQILASNKITATGAIGLFEFIEPRNFFISIDDGKNPAGVTAFKTKVLFEYDSNMNLKVIGVFALDYASSRYATISGSNPFSGAVRTRVRNPSYAGKLLEEIVSASGGSLSGGVTPATVIRPTVSSTGSIVIAPTATTNVSFDDIQKAYDKNKLADAVSLSTVFLAKNPTNVDALTIRARSQYIVAQYGPALDDITAIYKIQGSTVDCGIVKDGARAEKALSGSRGKVFTDLQAVQCKK